MKKDRKEDRIGKRENCTVKENKMAAKGMRVRLPREANRNKMAVGGSLKRRKKV